MPRGQEELARLFYRDAIGLEEVEKPLSLAGRGGCWFRACDGDTVTAEIHLGVDDPFISAKKAHPALIVDTIDELETIGKRVMAAGFDVSWAERDTLEGYLRFHARDGFGNRVEVLTVAV